jgi:hypothetical protein
MNIQNIRSNACSVRMFGCLEHTYGCGPLLRAAACRMYVPHPHTAERAKSPSGACSLLNGQLDLHAGRRCVDDRLRRLTFTPGLIGGSS